LYGFTCIFDFSCEARFTPHFMNLRIFIITFSNFCISLSCLCAFIYFLYFLLPLLSFLSLIYRMTTQFYITIVHNCCIFLIKIFTFTVPAPNDFRLIVPTLMLTLTFKVKVIDFLRRSLFIKKLLIKLIYSNYCDNYCICK